MPCSSKGSTIQVQYSQNLLFQPVETYQGSLGYILASRNIFEAFSKYGKCLYFVQNFYHKISILTEILSLPYFTGCCQYSYPLSAIFAVSPCQNSKHWRRCQLVLYDQCLLSISAELLAPGKKQKLTYLDATASHALCQIVLVGLCNFFLT